MLYLRQTTGNCWYVMIHFPTAGHHCRMKNTDNYFMFLSETARRFMSLVSEDKVFCPECGSVSLRSTSSVCSKKRHLSFLTKYNPQLNSWEDISSFDLATRTLTCVVAKDNFIYFLGGYLSTR